MKPTELLTFLSQGYGLRVDPSTGAATLVDQTDLSKMDIPPEVITELISAGLLSLSGGSEPEYVLTEKARMLFSMHFGR